jgi:dimethylaniline monooxygenase (N-oxide forming)
MQPILNTGLCQGLSDSTTPNLVSPIGIIGAGAAGLIHAHVLLQDGFSDVTLVSRDKSVGGTWARARVYPGLHINKYSGPF